MAINRPKGTNDILPQDMRVWHAIEQNIRDICQVYGYEEIRTPIFEHTELFQRGVGETSDIVEKEMYTFHDKGNRSITLRPEGTASVVRAFVESRNFAEAQPIKYYYQGPMFRYARPQAGRFRQFHQFGVEAFGTQDPLIDAEVIHLCMRFFYGLGLKNLQLHINSVGCKTCRPIHKEALKDYLRPSYDALCETCQNRFESNPLRIFDCKNESCQKIVKNAPTITSCLCEDCKNHLEELEGILKTSGVDYVLDEHLVRGLDYYTKTAFEIMVSDIGAQSSIGGGGRYDSLVEEVGGPDMPGIGFAIGLERTIKALEAQGVLAWKKEKTKVFVACVSSLEKRDAYQLLLQLRGANIASEMDVMDRSLKAQFKYANKQNFSYVITVGEEEIAHNRFALKNMQDGTENQLSTKEIIDLLKEESTC